MMVMMDVDREPIPPHSRLWYIILFSWIILFYALCVLMWLMAFIRNGYLGKQSHVRCKLQAFYFHGNRLPTVSIWFRNSHSLAQLPWLLFSCHVARSADLGSRNKLATCTARCAARLNICFRFVAASCRHVAAHFSRVVPRMTASWTRGRTSGLLQR